MTEEEYNKISDLKNKENEIKGFLLDISRVEKIEYLSGRNVEILKSKSWLGPINTERFSRMKINIPIFFGKELSDILIAKAREYAEGRLKEIEKEFADIQIRHVESL